MVLEQKQHINAERRQHERVVDPFKFLRMVDCCTQQVLGRVVDLSLGGFRLIGECPASIQHQLLVQIELKWYGEYSKIMAFEATSVWQIKRRGDRCCESGFCITELPSEDSQPLQRIIELLKIDTSYNRYHPIDIAP